MTSPGEISIQARSWVGKTRVNQKIGSAARKLAGLPERAEKRGGEKFRTLGSGPGTGNSGDRK